VLSPDVALSGGGVLTCLVDSLTITATVNSPSGVTGVWTGPGGFTSTQATITVTAPGPYTFEATAPNGCVSNPVMTIAQDLEEPQDLETTGGELNCNSTTITLTAGSSTPNVTYTWTDPGGVEINEQNPAVSTAGTYTLVVTNTANGCTSSVTQEVTQDPTVPEISASTGILTCLLQEVTMDATTTTPNVTFAWTGPNGFTSTEEDPVVSVPGSYTVVATATSGCTASFNLAVDQDVAAPGATAEGGTKTCTEPIVTLNGSSSGTDVTYMWSGPGGFTSSQPNPDVEVLGEYVLTVTAPNGCTSTATATVVPDNSIPTVSMTAGTITCVIDSVQLTATTSSTQPTWSWTGPNGFTSTLPPAAIPWW
jgi:hypothetical protein